MAELFRRRHAATGSLCMLATLKSDGSPRISPLEPNLFGGHLVIVGMQGTAEFRDLARDPRFMLHTATVDPHVSEGDAKVWGRVRHLDDEAFHAAFAQDLFDRTGFDLRQERFDPFWVADLEGASTLQLVEDHLEIVIWKPGQGERTVEKR